MANVRGTFSSANYEAGIKKLDVRDIIFQLQKEAAPFTTMLLKMRKARAVDTQITWFEDDLLGNYTTVNGTIASGILALVVDDSTIFQVGETCKVVESGECIFITGINTATHTLTIIRGWGTTSAAEITDAYYIYKLGTAMEEGYSSPGALVTAKTKRQNYLQIFSKTVDFTETSENVDAYGGNRRAFERSKKGVELKRDMEAQFLWGEPKEDTTSGAHPRRQTGGIYYFIALGGAGASLDQSSAALTESAFESWLKDLFLYDGSDRYLFCGPLIASQISQFASAKQRIDSGKTIKYGVKVSTYHSTMGDVHIVVDRHFIGPHAGKAIGVKMDEIIYRFLQNSDLKLALNVQARDSHTKKDEYSCTVGMEFHNSKFHGTITGVE